MTTAAAGTSSGGTWASVWHKTRPLGRAAASLGALLLIFECYVLIKWVTGPNFRAVAPGPSAAPAWMKLSVHITEIVAPALALFFGYLVIIRPWLRDREVTFDGLLFITAAFLSVYDCSSAYFHNWYTYNALFFNRGNPVTSLPGWQAFAAPGAQVAWPILLLPCLYPIVIVAMAFLGDRLLTTLRVRRPRMGSAARIAILFTVFVVAITVTEAFGWMRLGWYDMALWPAIFPSYWAHDALPNVLGFTAMVTAYSLLRSRNDSGETIVERGMSTDSSPKSIAIRFLAVFGATAAILLCAFQIPVSISTIVLPHSHWPSNMVDNSFLNDHICGYGTPRSCS